VCNMHGLANVGCLCGNVVKKRVSDVHVQKVQGHISSKQPTYDIVFNEEFISNPLTKCRSGNRWTNV
jgi:hypothetical protein